MPDIFNNIVPTQTTGLMLASLLSDFKDTVAAGLSGTVRPTNLQAGGLWVDTSLQEAPDYVWVLRIYTGSADIELFRISLLSGNSGASMAKDSFTVRRISADTTAAILNLVKNRVATSGQDLSGDTIAELRLTGRTNSSTDPIVAYIRATASEDMTSSARGVTLSLYSAPVATGTLVEHLRFLTSIMETVLPHKVNSRILGSDSVATATSILATSDKILSEFTGSTISTIHGVEVGAGETRFKILHNRSTADITIKDQSASASAAQRFSLPTSTDLVLRPNGSAAFYYCETDQRWKYLFGAVVGAAQYIAEFPDGYSEWVAPFTGSVRVVSFLEPSTEPTGDGNKTGFARSGVRSFQAWGDTTNDQSGAFISGLTPGPALNSPALKSVDIGREIGCGIGADGQVYLWGFNRHGQIPLLLVGLSQTAPTAGLTDPYTRIDADESVWAQNAAGQLFAWGRNQHGQLGVGDVASHSSPIAVLGGLKFAAVFHGAEGEASVYGVERDTGALYAWGKNDKGQLGVGDTASRSSPVAVLGGFKFRKVAVGSSSVVGLSESGVAYAWGGNTNGELGIGNVVPRSSPIAVLGGLVFKDVFVIPGTGNSFYGITDDGVLYAWGLNANGELGVGNVLPRSSPVAVLGGLTFERIARPNSATRSMIGIERTTGAAYAWGVNTSGQLGVGDTTPRSSPVAVSGGLKFSYLQFGVEFVFGEASDGRYYAWGKNDIGQVGDGSGVDKNVPTVVPAYTEPFFEVPTTKVVSVVKGTTYKLRIGGGNSFFDTTLLGKNIRRVTVSYEK